MLFVHLLDVICYVSYLYSRVPDLGSKGLVSQFYKLELEITSQRLILGASSTPTFYQKQSDRGGG